MAALGQSGAVTMYDIYTRLNEKKDGIAPIVEVLARSTPLYQDLLMIESNLLTGHKTTQRTSLPTIGTRRINGGVVATKSSTKIINDTVALYEDVSDVDVELMRINGMKAAFRSSEDQAKVMAFGQQLESDLFYADTASDETKFNGLGCRYDTPSQTRNDRGYYMLNAGGSQSDNLSIWLVSHDVNVGVHAFYPMGTQGSLEINDEGVVDKTDSGNGGSYNVYRTRLIQRMGLSVRHPGAVVRICNVDVSALTSDSSNADLIKYMEKATILMEETAKMGKLAFYMNKTARSALQRQARTQTNMQLSWGKDMFGGPVMEFQGIPIRVTDKLLNTEATISGSFQADI